MLALARRSPPCASVPPEQARDANRVAGGVKGGEVLRAFTQGQHLVRAESFCCCFLQISKWKHFLFCN